MKTSFIKTINILAIFALVLLLLPTATVKPRADASRQIPQDGLIAYWPLDETEGDTAEDVIKSVEGRNLKVKGNISWKPGKFGNAFEFDGNTVLQMDGTHQIKEYNLTVSLWAKLEDYPESDTGANILMANSDLAGIGMGAMDFGLIYGQPYSYVVMDFPQTGDRVIYEKDMKTDLKGKWTHFAVIYNTDEGFDYAKIFINGEEVAHTNLQWILGVEIKLGYPENKKGTRLPMYPFNFGGYSKRDGDEVIRSIVGLMDDIAIYNRALSLDEIKILADIKGDPTPVPTEAPTKAPDESLDESSYPVSDVSDESSDFPSQENSKDDSSDLSAVIPSESKSEVSTEPAPSPDVSDDTSQESDIIDKETKLKDLNIDLLLIPLSVLIALSAITGLIFYLRNLYKK